jgi:type I restriction enzyme S subunit
MLSVSEYRGIEVRTNFRDGQLPSEDVSHYRVVRPGQLVANLMWLDHGGLGVSHLPGYVSPAYMAFNISERVDPAFAHHVLRSSVYVDSYKRLGRGVRPNSQMVDSVDLRQLPFPLPPFETQQRIADYLDRETAETDAAVADLDKYVELLEKRRQVLVSEAVDSLSSASLIKTVRNLETLGWLELGRGKVISKEDMENSPGDYPVYSSAFTDNGFFGKYGEYLFEDERISWSIDGGGMPFYRHKHRYSLTNVSGWMRVADNSVLDVKYLYYAVLNEWYRNSFDYAFKAHPSVIRDLYSISIPALSSQQQMADYLDRETAEIDNLIAESKKLRDLLLKRRSVLITEVVTGRKQV